MRRGLKITLLVMIAPVAAFAIYVIIDAILGAVAPDEYYASSVGLSLSECEKMARTLGGNTDIAHETCWRRVPKKR